jgi:hypothetical protein
MRNAVRGLLILAALLLGGSAQAAIALVAGQTAAGSCAAATCSCVLPNNPTTGNLVVALVDVGLHNTISVADANSNAYAATSTSPAQGGTGGQLFTTGIYYLKSAPANALKTITATAANPTEIWCLEVSGADTVAPAETDNAHTNTATATALTDPTITTTNNGDLIVGITIVGNVVTSANAPFTDLGISASGNDAEYMIQSAAGAQTINFTQSGPATIWVASEAAFKVPSAGGAPSRTLTGVGQ